MRPAQVYEIRVNRNELVVELQPQFWNESITNQHGQTRLDLNIQSLVKEIQNALYWVSVDGKPPH